jgi:hypothetical protein
MNTYLASSLNDLMRMKHDIEKINIVGQKNLVAEILARGLMTNQHSWWIKIISLGSKERVYRVWRRMFNNNEEVFDEMFSASIRHMISGNDTENATSVGGWSQREINIVANLMA